MDILDFFICWQFALMSFSIGVIVFAVKNTIETLIPSFSITKWWTVLQPLLPIIIGLLCGLLFKHYPYPDQITSMSGRVFFSIAAGELSSITYRTIKNLLIKKSTESTE
jgi:hypothetical protein